MSQIKGLLLPTETMKQEDTYFVMDAKTFEVSQTADAHDSHGRIEEMPEGLNMDVATAKNTFNTYARSVANGEDSQLKRVEARMKTDLSEGPYYVTQTYVEIHTLFGGINPAQSLTNGVAAVQGRFAAQHIDENK